MPFTPFHFGPALFFGLLFFRYIHFPTFIIANVIVDIEPYPKSVWGLQTFAGFFIKKHLDSIVIGNILAYSV